MVTQIFQFSVPETSSFFDLPSPDEYGSQHQQPLQSNATTSLDFEIHASQWFQKENTGYFEVSKVILFKGIPEDTLEEEMIHLCQAFGPIKDIFIKKQKRYVYIQFEKVEQAQRCYESFKTFPTTLRGYSLYVFYTGKDDIDKANALPNSPSRFLHLIFHKLGFNLDPNFISQLVCAYGKCMRVLILSPQANQVFVEMEDVGQAMRAKDALDGKFIFNSTFMEVLFTEDKEVFVKGKPHSNVGLSTAGTLDHIPMLSPPIKTSNSFNNIWTEPQSPSSCIWPSVGVNNNINSPLFSMPNYHSETMIRSPHFPNEKQHQVLMRKEPNVQKQNEVFSASILNKEDKSPTILLIKNLPQGITSRMLFKLFGMYGNVLKVKIFFKNPENALIEYQTAEHAELAKIYLNNCPIYGNNIFVTNSKKGVIIDTSALKKVDETQYMGDYTNSPEHRYKFSGSKNHMNIVAPSKVLHISNLCHDKDDNFYANMFKEFGHIHKFMFLKGPEKMALLEMSTVEATVKILMNFHNFNINGKYLKVSFSKYQKIKDI
jgi:hnRNP-L/PTB/hephaestus splicing factor